MPYREVDEPPALNDTAADLELELRPYFRRVRLVLALVTVASLVGLAALPLPAGVALVVLFGACTLSARRRPLASSAVALSVCAALQIALAVVEPAALFDGILWKAFLCGALA